MLNFVKLRGNLKLIKGNTMKALIFSLLLLVVSACGTAQKVQYSAWEKVGVHKRDILVDRIEKTSAVQEQTKEEFKSAYEELASLVEIDDRGLEAKYKKLARAVESSEGTASELEKRIASVDRVAQDLFQEWKQELDQYQNQKLRAASEKNMLATQKKYANIYQQMQASYVKVGPVLEVLQDNTLYLKHNLNARAISGISTEVLSVEGKVAALIQEMEASISESKAFIDAMGAN